MHSTTTTTTTTQAHTPDRQKPILWKKQPREALTQPPAQIQSAALLFIRAAASYKTVLAGGCSKSQQMCACTLAGEPC